MEEKKCNCNEPYDAEYFQGGYPYCPVHDKPKESNMAIIGHGEPKYYPSSSYQKLFDYLHEEHGLTLLESEMNDLINVVHKFHLAAARWVKVDTKPEHNVGVLVFIPGEDNHITSGMWDISSKWVLLDEYRTPEEEVTHWMPLPAFPEGFTWNEIPGELVDVLKKVAKEELDKRGLPATPKPYDELYRLVFSNLAKLRARTQNNERMIDMADNIRAICAYDETGDEQELVNAPRAYHYLLRQHFDLFGLIPAGIAIDAKTVKQ